MEDENAEIIEMTTWDDFSPQPIRTGPRAVKWQANWANLGDDLGWVWRTITVYDDNSVTVEDMPGPDPDLGPLFIKLAGNPNNKEE